MQTITTIGLDIAKSVFQVHGIDAEGNVILRRQLKRRYVLNFFQRLPPCLVGIEACASAHHWSRELQTLGHTVRLMPPAYVKPYVKRHKNDATDAEAIRPHMAHRDRSHFGGRTSLSGHNGHGWSGGRPNPDANDPKRTCVAEVFRNAIRPLKPIPLTADPCCNNLIANIVGVIPSPGEQCDDVIS